MSQTLTKAHIVDKIFKDSPKRRSDVQKQVEALLKIIKKGIKKDHSLLISGFGKFETRNKKPRRGRNPYTNEDLMLEGRKVVVFRLSHNLRKTINQQG
ncbi:HU family DNA-binding protein [Desulfonatronovibrio magnus]|uniref:HU family DNA-binding protein n=1 Tax=Desulfonatronovibrio magnus TaxID=698827 RepID=UPI0005EB076B|nr:HU family DNA-binding protein [Desulfonatronovibrio magnus]